MKTLLYCSPLVWMGVVLPIFVGSANAAEVCVTCEGPTAVYRCQSAVGTSDQAPAAGMQLSCIKEIATRGGHASCSVNNTKATQRCDGVLVLIDQKQDPQLAPTPPAPTLQTKPTAPVIAKEATSPPDQSPPNPSSVKAPPATMEALAKDAAAQTKADLDKANSAIKESAQNAGEGVKKAGDAVGSAAKKTWDCLSSLFFAC